MSLFIDFLSTFSVIGIWPRFIEPKLLKTTKLTWQLSPNEAHLAGLRIIHLTDLHFHAKMSQKFLDKIIHSVSRLRPDLILFTGDFLCYSRLDAPEKFLSFLCHLNAPLGKYCIFGNHDYAEYVSLNKKGIYDLLTPPNPAKGLLRGLKILFQIQPTSTKVDEKVYAISHHEALCTILRKTTFKLLENKTEILPIGLNLTGLGDLALGRSNPHIAFSNYNPQFPGIVLSHNPDTFPTLLHFPGNWILSGHTHGEQIHIPWPKWGRKITRKLARLENSQYTRGLFIMEKKRLYVNRGLGCHKPFRFCSPPEICLIECVRCK
jgi:uncharacterized protein